ncbi:Adenosine-deaminase (editase) domain [Fragilaria crotonensis]|nr:Adenosine-deaminase (editase) domain [Fragilaria crotonensis]
MQTRPDRSILEKAASGLFRLKSEVTLHMYSSSAPCGNSTIKKFATMQKEVFDSNMGPNEWPSRHHEVIPPHSLKLGQFALLLKKDRTVTDVVKREPFEGGKSWPANNSDDWCPPGTTIVWSNQGSLHTCSDKICRWNYLGLQGLSVLIDRSTPLHGKSDSWEKIYLVHLPTGYLLPSGGEGKAP